MLTQALHSFPFVIENQQHACNCLIAAAPIIFLTIFAAKGPGFQEKEACSLLVNLRKGMQSSSEQSLVGRGIV